MRTTILFVLFSGLLAGAIVGVWLPERHASEPALHDAKTVTPISRHTVPSGHRDLGPKFAALKMQIERLSHRVDELARTLRRTRVSDGLRDPGKEISFSLAKFEIDTEEDIGAEGSESRRLENELQKRFAAEGRDNAWAQRMGAAFQSAVTRLSDFGLNDTQLVFQECRETLCNAEFVHGRDEDQKFLGVALAMHGIEQVTVVPQGVDEEGFSISKVYLFREDSRN